LIVSFPIISTTAMYIASPFVS